VRELVGRPREWLESLGVRDLEELQRVPEVLGALAPLMQVLGRGLLDRSAVRATSTPVDPLEARPERVETALAELPRLHPRACRAERRLDAAERRVVAVQIGTHGVAGAREPSA